MATDTPPLTSANAAEDWSVPQFRLNVVTVGIVLFWLVLIGRLLQLQVFERERLAALTDRQKTFHEVIPARAGDIVDRHGRLLATTVTRRSLYVDPQRIPDPPQFATDLAPCVELSADTLLAKITRHADKRFVWIKRRLTDQQATAIEQREWPAGSLGFRDEFLRCYPQGQLAAHVLGLRDIDGVGRGGIEQTYDKVIHGRDGKRQLVRDARGRVIDVREEVALAPKHGRTVMLTLDSVLQLYAEQELQQLANTWQPLSATAIVIAPGSGDVLAMASWPTFDPNNAGDASTDSWTNHAIASVYEPGSTFKPFVVAWAIEQGLLKRDDVLDCEHGVYRMGARILHDHSAYDQLSVPEVLVKSSNIGMAKIGERLGNAGLYDAVQHWGFNATTGVELPGELDGLVQPLKRWNDYSLGSVPMGHEFAVTPLQLATAHAALANGGQRILPRLVLRHTDAVLPTNPNDPAIETRPKIASRVVSAGVCNWLIEEPLTAVVARGTGRRARLPGYTIFGKTGTAQKFDAKTGTYSRERHVVSFVCGGPSKDPQAVVLIVVDEPHGDSQRYGGTVAAPAAASLLRRTLIHLRVPTETQR